MLLYNTESVKPWCASQTKRLGDGFYEQKLVREQIAQLTGRRFLTGYSNDEAEYQALMMNGVTVAKQFKLAPGVLCLLRRWRSLPVILFGWLSKR